MPKCTCQLKEACTYLLELQEDIQQYGLDEFCENSIFYGNFSMHFSVKDHIHMPGNVCMIF